MRIVISALALLVASTLTLQAQDQDDPPKLIMSSFECDWNEAIPWMNQLDSLDQPIWQELVDEGMLGAWGVLGHDFAGYDNVLVWRVAPTLAAFEEAQDEFGRRFSARHPDVEAPACTNHHDAIYSLGPGTGPPRDGFPTAVLSFYRCDNSMRYDIAESLDSLMLPIAQEMVDEDLFGNWGIMIHDWAGVETIVQYRSAKDRASFFEAWQEMGRRMSERHPGADPFLGCNQHRDGLYQLVTKATGPPPSDDEPGDE